MDALLNTYTLSQWLLLFYIYCFMGWIWECCYVSVRYHKWTNRGFMHGPLLPIYGSGAIAMLFSTLPVKNNPILVFIVASLTATVLEFCTGTVMQSIFRVRYWDYTRYRFNYKGHICLVASLAWGAAGVLTVFFINKPLDTLVNSLPETTGQLIAFAVTIAAAIDFGISFREAMDMREILMRISEEADRQVKKISRRVDVAVAVYGDEIEKGMEHVGQLRQDYMEKLGELKDAGYEKIDDIKNAGYEKIDDIKNAGYEKLDWLKDKLDTLPGPQKIRVQRYINANPDIGSEEKNISAVLKVLKERTYKVAGNLRFIDKIRKSLSK